ncbi:hypothetical protein KUCAC02_036665 [Chaenocephalus aceratus]|nr:hypothetical protein KUCAC02_036665 [Chaenocephalus aceratus]
MSMELLRKYLWLWAILGSISVSLVIAIVFVCINRWLSRQGKHRITQLHRNKSDLTIKSTNTRLRRRLTFSGTVSHSSYENLADEHDYEEAKPVCQGGHVQTPGVHACVPGDHVQTPGSPRLCTRVTTPKHQESTPVYQVTTSKHQESMPKYQEAMSDYEEPMSDYEEPMSDYEEASAGYEEASPDTRSHVRLRGGVGRIRGRRKQMKKTDDASTEDYDDIDGEDDGEEDYDDVG